MTDGVLRILIADDNSTDRLILGTILRKEGHQVTTAENGQQAVELFEEIGPDIVLLDAMMPVMDGYEAAIHIKRLAGDTFVPIIFLTSLKEVAALARCLEVGGDDFLTKPYNKVILQAKLQAFNRMRSLYATIESQKDKIQVYNDHLMQEQEVAKKVFDNIAHPGCLDSGDFSYILSPMSVFNGDMLLAADKPSGAINILVGDFTGHGLPAAIGAMPVSEIFYGMTIKGFAIADILAEVNKRLKAILPTGVFCCAIAAEYNPREDLLQIWNGGLPDAYLLKSESKDLIKISSKNLPLGVLAESSFKNNMEVYNVEPGDRICMLTDGIVEANNAQGEMYGFERLEQVVQQSLDKKETLKYLVDDVYQFRGELEQDDDFTFLEFVIRERHHIEEALKLEQSSTFLEETSPQEWILTYELKPDTLKSIDPLPVIMQVLMENAALRHYRSTIFTILAELYSNSLDHGVLGLDSSLKSDPVGFAKYYQLRSERLAQLEQRNYIRICIGLNAGLNDGRLTIRIEDSGKGFDISQMKADVPLVGFSGRGIPLLRNLCDSVEYLGDGNLVEAVYTW